MHFEQIPNQSEFLELISKALFSNDPVFRALSIKILGLFRSHIQNHLDIFHQILFLYETTGFQFEKKIIFEVLNEFIKGSETFSLILVSKLTKKIENGDLDDHSLGKMMNLVSIAKIDFLNIEKYLNLLGKMIPICHDPKKKRLLSYFSGRISLMTGLNLDFSIGFIEKNGVNKGVLKKILERLKRMKGLMLGEASKKVEVFLGGQGWLENYDFRRKDECSDFVELIHKSVILIIPDDKGLFYF